MIAISDKAQEMIREKLSEHLPRQENNRDGKNIPTVRLGILPEDMRKDYSGFRYLFCEDGSVEGDTAYDFEGFTVLVHASHLEEVNGMQIDWRVDGIHERFDFAAPCHDGVCPCGIEHGFDNVKMLNIEKPEPIDFEAIYGKATDEDIVSESEGS